MSKQTKIATVRLLSKTEYPIETIYCEWLQSRTTDPVPDPAEVHRRMTDATDAGSAMLTKEVFDVFEKVVAMKMPLGETLDFVFLLENISIAFREQLVRHRIGHKFGDKLGADIVPDLAGNSSFWSQTTRIIDMGQFANKGEYLVPNWLHENENKPVPGKKKEMWSNDTDGTVSEPVLVGNYYHAAMQAIEHFYNGLVSAGMPLEDARNVLPVAMQHRMTWKVNLASLMHVLSRRGCWLAQLGMWEPIIVGIVEELATKVHPSFRRLIDPPCFDAAGNYNACAFGRENEEIVSKGEYPPCSLWVNHEYLKQSDRVIAEDAEKDAVEDFRMPRYQKMMSKYEKLWMRDPRTGERKQVG